MSRLTLFTDASFEDTYKTGGWGAWAKREGWDRGRMFGQRFRVQMNTPDEAETCAVASAVVMLEKAGALDGVKEIALHMDATLALGYLKIFVEKSYVAPSEEGDAEILLKKAKPSKLGKAHEAVMIINKICLKRDIRLRLQHVRGHQQGGGRYAINRLCDQEARRHMVRARSEAKVEKRAQIRRAKATGAHPQPEC